MSKLVLALLITLNLLPGGGGVLKKPLQKIATDQITTQKKTKPVFTMITIPSKVNDGSSDFISGKANIALDLASGEIISQNNANSRLEIASITKLMTAYIILKDQPLNKVVEVPQFTNRSDDSIMGIIAGDKLTIQDLLSGLLINSGGDAAQALAIIDSGSVEKFVEKMNQTAVKLGFVDTHFASPIGWDDQNNYSTAKEMATLARINLRNNVFAAIVSTKSEVVYTQAGRPITLTNTNLLLDNPAFSGVKTGYTIAAGECLVALNTTDGHGVLSVILGSNDRFGQTLSYFDWIHTHFLW